MVTDSSREARQGQDLGSATGVERPTPLYERVYAVLVNEAGAMEGESNRLQFKSFWTRSDDPDEYRFIGKLGFGGKFWKGRDKWYVNCYREDETPERLEIIARTNAALDTERNPLLRVERPQDPDSGVS